MVDRVNWGRCVETLTTVIGEIMEENLDAAIRVRSAKVDLTLRAAQFETASQDIGRLAAALQVLARRAPADG